MISDNTEYVHSDGSLVSNDEFSRSRLGSGLPVVPTSPVGEAPPSIGPKSILHAVRRRWKLALPIGLVCSGVLATAAWVLLVPKYTAVAYLRLDAENRPLIFNTTDQARSDFKIYKNTHAQLMKTPFVLNAALRDSAMQGYPDIAAESDPLTYLQKEVKVTYPNDGELMEVSFSASDATSAIGIVNAIVTAFMDEVVENEKGIRIERLKNLRLVYTKAEENVRAKQETLKNLAQLLGTGNSDSLTVAEKSALQQFGQMQENLSEVQFKLMQAEGNLESAKQIATLFEEAQAKQTDAQVEQAEAERESAIAAMIDRDRDVIVARNDVENTQGRLLVMSQTYGSGYPSFKVVEKELAYKQELLAKRREGAREAAIEAVKQEQEAERKQMALRQSEFSGRDSQAMTSRNLDIVTLDTQVQILKKQEELLIAKVQELSKETRKLGESSFDIELMRSEIERLDEILQRVGSEIERTTIEMDTASRITLSNKATTATVPDISKRLTRSAALGMFGLFAPLMMLVGWDLSHRRVDGADSVSNILSVPTLGTLPMVSPKILFRDPPDNHRLAPSRIQLVEAIDSLCSLVQFLAQTDASKVFLVTSAIPSEGKSTVSCQLADGLARAGNRVLLIDFDLRRPTVHQYLKLSNTVGASELFDGSVSMDEAFQTIPGSGLVVLTAGSGTQNMQSLCNSGAIEELLGKCRDDFDLIIVDSCPILPVADTRSLVKYCDGVILTLIRDFSRMPLVAQACEILKSYRAQIVGGVIIGGGRIGYAKQYYQKKIRSAESESESKTAAIAKLN